MRALIIAVILVLSGCKAETVSKPVTNEILYPHFKRPNLVVSDLEKSLTIYRDILEFEAGTISNSSSDSFSYPVFNIPKDAIIRSVTLSESAEARVIALTEVSGANMAALPNTPHRTAHVIGVTDLHGKIEKVQALGLTITESKIAGGVDFEFIEQAFVDYDGHLIVLYEVLPNKN